MWNWLTEKFTGWIIRQLMSNAKFRDQLDLIIESEVLGNSRITSWVDKRIEGAKPIFTKETPVHK